MTDLDLAAQFKEVREFREDRINTAVFSACGLYRYLLTRELGGAASPRARERVAAFCGCNPSTATAETDDPTVRRDIGFAKRWGCGRMLKVNANAYRATDPDDMHAAARSGIDVVGRPDNDQAIREVLEAVKATDGIFVLACSKHVSRERLIEVCELVRAAGVTPMCFKTNQDGSPAHELYQKWTSKLIEYPMQKLLGIGPLV